MGVVYCCSHNVGHRITPIPMNVVTPTCCRAGSSSNNLALLNFEYLASYLCAYDLECNQFMIPLSLLTSHSMHSTCNHMAHPHDGGIFCRH